MSPLRNAMGFVYGKQSNFAACEQVKKTRRQQAFRGDIEQVELALQQIVFDLIGACRIEARIEKGSFYLELQQSIHLILHQRDQGRDDNTNAGTQQGGDLITEGFAAA